MKRMWKSPHISPNPPGHMRVHMERNGMYIRNVGKPLVPFLWEAVEGLERIVLNVNYVGKPSLALHPYRKTI